MGELEGVNDPSMCLGWLALNRVGAHFGRQGAAAMHVACLPYPFAPLPATPHNCSEVAEDTALLKSQANALLAECGAAGAGGVATSYQHLLRDADWRQNGRCLAL